MAQPPPPAPTGSAWHPPPAWPPPGFSPPPPTDRDARAALVVAIGGNLLLLPSFGILGLVLGAIAYFLGRAARSRIDTSQGRLAGHSAAQAGIVLGVALFALGAAWLLFWLVLLFVAIGSQSR